MSPIKPGRSSSSRTSSKPSSEVTPILENRPVKTCRTRVERADFGSHPMGVHLRKAALCSVHASTQAARIFYILTFHRVSNRKSEFKYEALGRFVERKAP